MKIRLKNQIELDGQTELIDQIYEADWKEKGGFCYLIYENEESERVILKFDAGGLSMTRFSNPKSLMRFCKNGTASVDVPTPLGLQQFLTQTELYELDLDQQTLQIAYRLTSLDSQQVFADYHLQISWS